MNEKSDAIRIAECLFMKYRKKDLGLFLNEKSNFLELHTRRHSEVGLS